MIKLTHFGNYTNIHAPGWWSVCTRFLRLIPLVVLCSSMVGDPHGPKPFLNNTRSFKPAAKFSTCEQFQDDACCIPEQVDYLYTQIQQAFPMFGSCPSCMSNFINLWSAPRHAQAASRLPPGASPVKVYVHVQSKPVDFR